MANRVCKSVFESWVENMEHSQGVKVQSRITGSVFITNYCNTYDEKLLAKCISTDDAELYYIFT